MTREQSRENTRIVRKMLGLDYVPPEPVTVKGILSHLIDPVELVKRARAM